MVDVKRLGIFATYCRNGIVDDYIIYYLSEIRKSLTTLVVVSNIALTTESRKKAEVYADYIFEREDQGYDVGGLRSVMTEYFGWDRLKAYDELVLMNDSAFGPFYPFEEVFMKMEQYEDLDFWGLSKRGKSDFDGGDVHFPEHIQLYFYVIRKKLLHSKDFEQYWNDISDRITNFRTAIFQYEFAFTQYFAERGYKWDVYCHLPGYETDDVRKNLSPYHYASYELIKKFRCPLLKRKLFTGEFVEMKYSGREDLSRVFQYIKEETDYDVDLIWKYILPNYPMQDIIESLKLCYTLNSKDNISEIEYQKWITLVKCSRSDNVFDELFQDKQLINGDLREWNDILLVELQAEEGDAPHSIAESEEYRNYENLVKSEAYVTEVIRLFKDNPRLGVLVPPAPMYGHASDYIMSKWKNGIAAREIYDELKLQVPFDEDRAPVPAMTAFLCRKGILDDGLMKLIASMTASEFSDVSQVIPLYAQEKNYYTAYLQSSDYAGVDFFNKNRLLYELLKQLDAEASQDINTILDRIRESNIKEFCDENEYIYIYGAGQLAQRAAGIIEHAGREFDSFVVTSMSDNVDVLRGHKVCAIEEVKTEKDKTGFIIAAGKNHNKKVSENLRRLGYDRQLIF